MSNNWEEGNLSFLDIITIVSFVIGVENLRLNEQQNKQLDQHLHDQDNKLLSKIIAQNDEIIKLLRERK